MLFTYRYLENHPIEKLQSWLDYLVLEVWCKAEGAYDISLLDGCGELRAVVEDFHYSESKYADLFNRTIEEVFAILKDWPENEKAALAESYRANNAVEALCESSALVPPITYKALESKDHRLAEKLGKFYKALYTDILHLKPISSRTGEIADHYREFTTLNDEDRCPFCGLHRLKGQYAHHREAYDHYLPKNLYPFNSVNFRNLAPMCHECNSTYKLAKDPLYKSKPRDPLFGRENRRRKAIYPYSSSCPIIEISVKINSKDIARLKPENLELEIKAPGYEEQIEVWKELFSVESRYKETYCGKNDGKYWHAQIVDELVGFSDDGQHQSRIREAMDKLRKRAARNPWADLHFIKLPFLEGCERAGLFGENKILSR